MSKPEVVAWMWRDINGDVQFNYMHPDGEELIRLADHERLQAEAERLQADREAAIAELSEQKSGWVARAKALGDKCDQLEAARAADKARIGALEAANAINMPGLLEDLDEALEELALRGRHDDRGYQLLRAWYSKMRRVTRTVDAALAQQGKEGET